jgi:hypothetical protein
MPMVLEDDYIQRLDEIIDELFSAATYQCDWTWNQFAAESGLAYSTVCRLGERTTRVPHLRTIFRMANAVGMDVKVLKRKLRIQKAA